VARDSIQRSQADHIKDRLETVSRDVRSTWRTAPSLLHTTRKAICDDADCENLVTTFSRFFVDKIHANIPSARQFVVKQHVGLTLAAFRPVTTDEVCQLLSTMPSKSSPLDALPCLLMKSCTDVFVPVLARLANLLFQTGKFPACYKRAQVLLLLKKAGLDSSSPANYRPISKLSTISKIQERLVLARL